MEIEPTGIIVRVRDEKGYWVNIDIALLSAIQQKEFLSTVDEEKSYAWLPSIIMELCKKQAQNADLVAMLITVRDNIEDDPDIYWKNDLVEQIEQALAQVGDE